MIFFSYGEYSNIDMGLRIVYLRIIVERKNEREN